MSNETAGKKVYHRISDAFHAQMESAKERMNVAACKFADIQNPEDHLNYVKEKATYTAIDMCRQNFENEGIYIIELDKVNP